MKTIGYNIIPGFNANFRIDSALGNKKNKDIISEIDKIFDKEYFQKKLLQSYIEYQEILFNNILKQELELFIYRKEIWDKLYLKNRIRAIFKKATDITKEQIRLMDIGDKSGITDFASAFIREQKRKIILHIGPTNSGKTYQALEHLKNANTGIYCAPLRLMAMEYYDKLKEYKNTDMATGEESFININATHLSCTIEMADLSKNYEVAIIDEGQMLADNERGWAWSQAILGLNADTIYITGPKDCIPYIKKIMDLTGEIMEIKYFDRMVPLILANKCVTYDNLEKGDAIVAFSRKEIFRIRELLKNKKVSTIYGALSPEIRRKEAERFTNGETDILIATDAIGMGLNLPIKRLIFSSTEKFDGKRVRNLTLQEIKQISGRAGRYGLYDEGIYTATNNSDLHHLNLMKNKKEHINEYVKLYIFPTLNMIKNLNDMLGTEHISKLLVFAFNLLKNDDNYKHTDIKNNLQIARWVDEYNFDIITKFKYIFAPICDENNYILYKWITQHYKGNTIDIPDFDCNKPYSSDELKLLEGSIKIISLYCWLSYKWPEIYIDYNKAVELRDKINRMIEYGLKSKLKNSSSHQRHYYYLEKFIEEE